MEISSIRYAGILMHITSLPGRYGIGTLGKEAYDFADALHETGATIWQILPFSPTGYGNSPYAPRSSFAGNEMFINLEDLVSEGLLEPEDLDDCPEFRTDKVEFNKVYDWKLPILKKAAKTFIANHYYENSDYIAFKKKEKSWLRDYALFMMLYERYQDARWFSVWASEYSSRNKSDLQDLQEQNPVEYESWIVLQYIFQKQWMNLKTYINDLGIQLVGDIPIFVGADSADTWSNLELFKTDSSGRYSAQAGVPPDCFSATGQLWGNPVYNWPIHENTGFKWWIERIRRVTDMVDILRIDHFRGFDAYYEIKAGAKDAVHGKWRKSPGKKLFKALESNLGKLNIIAEDLGILTPSVEKLRDGNGFPGMKIAQFGFVREKNGIYDPYDTFLPHNYSEPFVAYTGTHDNDTTRGWFDALSEEDKHMVREYLSSNNEEIVWNLIKAVMLSNARFAIIPMQDILELGNDSRMNFPSTCNDKNWSWKMETDAFDSMRLSKFAHYVRISGRNGLSFTEFEQINERLKLKGDQ